MVFSNLKCIARLLIYYQINKSKTNLYYFYEILYVSGFLHRNTFFCALYTAYIIKLMFAKHTLPLKIFIVDSIVVEIDIKEINLRLK